MLRALICSRESVERDLADTVLWRKNVVLRVAETPEEAHAEAIANPPNVIVIDHRFPDAPRLVARFRENPATRRISIVALARGDFSPAELEILEAGANAILRLPPGPDWDDRLTRLVHVPMRREARFDVALQLEAGFGTQGDVFSATALNLSVNGMLIQSEQALQVGDDVHFAFQLPGEDTFVNGMGTVVRHGSQKGQYGVELSHVKGDGRQRIKKFVDSNSNAP
jgi:CheY-like chemotaxis protein